MYFRKCQFCFPGPRLQVFDEIGTAVIDQAFSGYNATVFAYGQVRRSTTPSRSWGVPLVLASARFGPHATADFASGRTVRRVKGGGKFPNVLSETEACMQLFDGLRGAFASKHHPSWPSRFTQMPRCLFKDGTQTNPT